MKRAYVGLAVVLGVLAPAAAARAESAAPPQTCELALVPRPGEKIPENAPALVVRTNAVVATLRPAKLAPGDAEMTPARDTRSPRAFLLDPAAKLTVGPNRSVTIDGSCYDGRYPSATSTFEVVASAPLPTVAGTVTTRPPMDGTTYAPLVLTPAPELLPFLPLTRFELDAPGVDGWSTLEYGDAVLADGGVVVARVGAGGFARDGRSSPALCSAGDNAKKTVALTLRAHVAGATTDPPAVPFDVVVDCSEPPPAPSVSDAGVDDPGATNAATFEGGGCNATNTADFGVFGIAFVAGALTVGRAARRRGPR